MAKMKKLNIEDGQRFNISRLPNFHKSGSVKGMKKLYYGKNALLVKCGDLYIIAQQNQRFINKKND